MPHEDKDYDGSLVLDFRKAVTSRENDLYSGEHNQCDIRMMGRLCVVQ